MKLRYRLQVLCVLLLCAVANLCAQSSSPLQSAAINQKVEQLLKQMTLEEKVGQLNQYSAGAATGPGTGRTGYPEMIAAGQVGSLFNLIGVQEDQRNAAHRDGKIAAAHSADVRAGCDSRISHGISHAAGISGDVGSRR